MDPSNSMETDTNFYMYNKIIFLERLYIYVTRGALLALIFCIFHYIYLSFISKSLEKYWCFGKLSFLCINYIGPFDYVLIFIL